MTPRLGSKQPTAETQSPQKISISRVIDPVSYQLVVLDTLRGRNSEYSAK
jgi:hypothetical protein